MSTVFPEAILRDHTAILGMTGSGKSTTARDLVEQVVPSGSRVCILDTVKSDWWGITSSADGKRAGLPFTIIGGPHGHLPLTRHMGKAIAEVVATGALPLTIIDMADFGPGDLSHFFVEFAPVLMRKMKGVLYLILEEAHEIAPKERAGFKQENMGVYWAKKLATAGRTKGLRLIPISQRVQALHNAVLGSCQTLIVHNMTAPADQEPVIKWAKGNIKDPALRRRVEESLSELPTGTGWMCSGKAKIFELVKFPKAKTFDNTATPEDDSEIQEVKTATVDTEQLRKILADSVKEAEANDPTALKRRIAELERDARNQKPAPAAPAPALSAEELNGYYQAGYVDGRQRGWKDCAEKAAPRFNQMVEHALSISADVEALEELARTTRADLMATPTMDATGAARPRPDGVALTSIAHPTRKTSGIPLRPRSTLSSASLEGVKINIEGVDHGLPPIQVKILAAAIYVASLQVDDENRLDLIALKAGYESSRTKSFTNALSALRTAGFIKGVTATEEGRRLLRPSLPASSEELQLQLFSLLEPLKQKLLTPLIERYPDGIDRESLARGAGYESVRTKSFTNALSRLRSLGLVEYAGQSVLARPALFLP